MHRKRFPLLDPFIAGSFFNARAVRSAASLNQTLTRRRPPVVETFTNDLAPDLDSCKIRGAAHILGQARKQNLTAICRLLTGERRVVFLSVRQELVGYPSGQRGQTVNLLAYAFDGSNPSPTTTL
jgi:hypothetical protein